MCLERAHGCLGACEGGPVVPGPPPLGSWGGSRGSRGAPLGGGPGPKSEARWWLSLPSIRIKIHVDLDIDF